jgi:LAS superfamily LD-carboxypeptidase LdcB
MTPFRELDELETGFDTEWECGVFRRDRVLRSPSRRHAAWGYRVEPVEDDTWDYELPETGGVAKWTGTAEQLAFRERVLQAHITRSGGKKNTAPKPDLRDDQLALIPGLPEQMKMRSVAANAAGDLLRAANADLQTARAAGHADALRTMRITAASGYRGRAHQRRVWLGNFVGYYNDTMEARSRIADGPHSDAALRYMLEVFQIPKRVAAPGYSNHQSGIAIDFQQVRVRGQEVRNSTHSAAVAKWHPTWFFGWLQANAARFGFEPYTFEPWHWEYRSGRVYETVRVQESEFESPPVQTGSYLGGLIHTFQSKSVPRVNVSVFCPAAAIGKSSVDVLVYAHGLIYGPCAAPKALPKGLIDEQPFTLGRIVHDTGHPIVLVVPFFDWQARGNVTTFGATARALKNPDNLNRLVEECLDTIGVQAGAAQPSLARLILAGHSRGYAFLEPLGRAYGKVARLQGALASLAAVWALDTTYSYGDNDTDANLEWVKRPGTGVRVSVVYLAGSGTAPGAKRLARIGRGSVRVVERNPQDYRTSYEAKYGRKYRGVPHCDVPGNELPALLRELKPERQPESETAPLRRIYPDALMEHLSHLASHAETEDEAADRVLPLVGLAMGKLPAIMTRRLTGAQASIPRIAAAIRAAEPQLTAAIGRIARSLYRRPNVRPLLQALPSIVRQTIDALARLAASGHSIPESEALRTLARQSVRVLGSRPLRGQALSRSRALDARLHRHLGPEIEPHARSVAPEKPLAC